MKNQLFALIGLGLLLATASAYAQTGVVKASVPFNFIVDKTEVPAGQYVIQPIGSTGTALALENAKHEVVKLILPNSCQSSDAQAKTKLIFRRYGTRYFLSQIWTKGNTRGVELRRSPLENELALDYPTQNVVVVATLR
jgi:hypothetical protein